MWTQKDCHIERIEVDVGTTQKIVQKSSGFFQNAVLPELVGRYYSRSCNTSEAINPMEGSDGGAWCYCKQPYNEERDVMIGCDNDKCKIQWFHQKCLKLKRIPAGKWYCPDCTKDFKRKVQM